MVLKLVSSCFQLTKPTIMLLVLFTGAAALVIEGSMLSRPVDFLLVLVGLYLTGGSANALNQYFERDIDAQMSRTRNRRPLPLNRISPIGALVFSVSIGLMGVLLFYWYFNFLTALLALGNILFYSLFYTLYLKPNTSQNIVIGGIAGAMAPVGAWTAATGHFDIFPWLMFLIIFLWTPPHFWTLAVFSKKDYERVGLPMMPVVKGDGPTYNRILAYSVVLFAVSMMLLVYGAGWFYLLAAVSLGGMFVWKSIVVRKLATDNALRSLFGFSLVYLFGLFSAMMIDRFV